MAKMTSKMPIILALAFFTLSAAARASPTERSEMPVNVYVAPFISRNVIDAEVLSSFRDLFEEAFGAAFTHTGVYKVLNREIIEKIVAESQNEAGLASVDELNSRVKARLRVATADGFIFGEVTDDKDSGEVIVEVKLQSFDSVLWWNKSVSIKRGLIRDRSSRKAAMEQLVKAIDAFLKPESGMSLAQLDADVTLQPQGSPSVAVHMVITPDADKTTYTARIANGPTYINGALAKDLKTFEFSSVKAGGMYSLDGRAYKTSGGQLQLTLNRTLDLSDEGQASGNISGVFALTSVGYPRGGEETQNGQIVGTFKESFIANSPNGQLPPLPPAKLASSSPEPKSKLLQLHANVIFQPAGFPSGQIIISITANGDGTYTATIAGGTTFTNGVITNEGRTCTFRTMQPGGLLVLGNTILRGLEGSLDLTLSGNSDPSGSVTGELSIVGTTLGHAGEVGIQTKLSGQIVGTYNQTLVPK
jgi:hypothetical protein